MDGVIFMTGALVALIVTVPVFLVAVHYDHRKSRQKWMEQTEEIERRLNRVEREVANDHQI